MVEVRIVKCEDGVIWVTSDSDRIGMECTFKQVEDPGDQMLIALAEFLGYEPSEVLNLESIER